MVCGVRLTVTQTVQVHLLFKIHYSFRFCCINTDFQTSAYKFWVSFSWRKCTNETIRNLKWNAQQITWINNYVMHENFQNVHFSETKNRQYHDISYSNLSNPVTVLHRVSNIFTSSKNDIRSCSAWIYFVRECAQILCATCIIFREDSKDKGCFTTEKWVSISLPVSYSMMKWFFFTFVWESCFMKHTNSNKTAAFYPADSANKLNNDINFKTASLVFKF